MITPHSPLAFRALARIITCAMVLAMLAIPGMVAFPSRAVAKAGIRPARQRIISPASAATAVAYNSIPAPLPPNIPSLGYQANQTAEFGDLIQFAGTNRTLTTVTLVMSDWAVASDFGSSSPTWSYPLTLNLYSVNNSGPNPEPGTLIATRTNTFEIPWRPPASPGCSGDWKASDGNCYGGLAFTITFDFSGVVVPNQIIYGLAFNTETYGSDPTDVSGPYISLNFGLAEVPPSAGTNPLPNTAYWNTVRASNYTDGGAAGVGIFRQDTNWAPLSGAITFNVVLPFDTCLQDNATGDFLQWNSATGAYQFTHCGKNGFVLSGTGTVASANGMKTLNDKESDRNISASFNTGQLTGTANVSLILAPGLSAAYRINDTNPHPTCTCGG
ncbi:MAG TPA: hypothetical protein VI756_20160 [Blastocatellia bacterium]